MIIETTRGPMDESELWRSIGTLDTENTFQSFVEYRARDNMELVFRQVTGGFVKVNRFASPDSDHPVNGPVIVEENGALQTVEASELDRLVGVVDNENEYTSWVEYRRPGSATVVKRSCAVVLKKGIEAGAILGQLGG